MDSEGKGTGIISKQDESGICTGHDKLRDMKRCVENHGSLEPILTMYVGDSNTDLPCLLHADIGIIMGNNSSLAETCRRVGITIVRGSPLTPDSLQTRRPDPRDRVLYQYDDWNAVVHSGLFD
jgi:hypothetical protein